MFQHSDALFRKHHRHAYGLVASVMCKETPLMLGCLRRLKYNEKGGKKATNFHGIAGDVSLCVVGAAREQLKLMEEVFSRLRRCSTIGKLKAVVSWIVSASLFIPFPDE